MKFSVILITYNQERYVNEAIESILMQQFDGEVELIIADDCSTDETLSIIKSYENKSPFPFRYLKNESNIGISKNYQNAFSNCTGDYIAVLEGDDYWCLPYKLQKLADFLNEHRECIMVMNSYISLLENAKQFVVGKDKDYDGFKYVTLTDMLQANRLGNLSSCVFRTSAINKIKPELFDLPIENVDDWLLGLAVSEFGLIALYNEVMTIYRVNENGSWSKLTIRQKYESILTRISVYNEFFEYKYSYWFEDHASRIKKAIENENRNENWPPLMIMGNNLLIWIVKKLKGIPKLFISRKLKIKIKKALIKNINGT